MANIDPDLLRSPYAEPASRRFPVPIVIAATVIAVGAAVLGAWLLVRSGPDGDDEAAADASTTTTIGIGSARLVPHTSDPPILTHPTVLPEGWDTCAVTDGRFEPDRFCAAGSEAWIDVAYAVPRPSDPETAVSAGLHDGEWVSERDPLEVRFPVNEHVALSVEAHGLEADQVLEIADSIPILADRADLYGSYELPIDWESMTADDLVGLLDQFEGDAVVDLGRFELTVRTSNATLYGFNSRGYWTPVAATDLPMARLVEADRPLVVGASPELQKGYAVWDQAGFSWRLEGNLDAEGATALALSVVAKLSDLPLDVSR